MTRVVPPSASETAFNCPHCGALAKQFWFSTAIDPLDSNQKPAIWTAGDVASYDYSKIEADERHELKELLEKLATGRPFKRKADNYNEPALHNVHVSECFNCREFAIWLYGKMIWPAAGTAPTPNPDLPPEVRTVYDEAGTILALSPRGAAALLRLAVQLLTLHLGEKGKNLDDDIAALVKKGLDARVQIALDVVRVVGNNAVHPGQLDLRDDAATAEKLFGLVNLISEIMISQPKHLNSMFAELPEGARQAIARRDGEPKSPNSIETK